uniref:Uncharacterized protein n=1 Tax=Mus musculus TaxID=10090 RepID=Q3UXV9_MOUSE|nr:unnamed protein product [Mus musculus]
MFNKSFTSVFLVSSFEPYVSLACHLWLHRTQECSLFASLFSPELNWLSGGPLPSTAPAGSDKLSGLWRTRHQPPQGTHPPQTKAPLPPSHPRLPKPVSASRPPEPSAAERRGQL